MLRTMQDWPLRVTQLIDHAAREHGGREIVSGWTDRSRTRSDWKTIRYDALRMVQALWRLGIAPGDRIATLAMNHGSHLASWYGSTGMGGVLHTLNPRLFDDQLDYIVNHAEDRVLLYDATFQPLIDRMKPRWRTVEHYVCFDNGEFDQWLGAEDGDARWSTGEERDPCMLCYTSGTTGNPKGVLYEHRSTMLHAISVLQPAIFALEARSVILPIVPMFHAASWGLPWAAAAAGAKLVYSTTNDAQALCALMREEGVTHAAGVPTVWLAMFQHVDSTGQELPPLQQLVVGGSAAPASMIERFMQNGTRILHAWGMTETSPIGTVGLEPAGWDNLGLEERIGIKSLQGRVPFGVEIRCLDLDDARSILPRDGKTAGALQVRGPWVLQRYFKAKEDAVDAQGWFDTGDVGIIHPDGTLQLTDRTKDVIKSGGEWISSVELENLAMGHPAIAEAAAIGVFHPKWDERPILVVARKPGAHVSAQDIRGFLEGKVARWWLPDAVEFVDSLPHTGTGKISKKDLRDMFADYRLQEG